VHFAAKTRRPKVRKPARADFVLALFARKSAATRPIISRGAFLLREFISAREIWRQILNEFARE